MMGIQTDELRSFQPKPNKTDKDRNLANAVASKLEDGNFKAALRLICSDDTPAPDNQDTFQALLDKYPQAPEDRKSFKDPKESSNFTPFQASSDVSKALRSFPLGSSGGPDGVTPQHLRDLINNNADVMLLQTLTDFVNLLLSGSIPNDVKDIIFGGRLIALHKSSGCIRPIVTGYTWRRIAAKYVNSLGIRKMSSYLSPIQLGVGASGGTEAAVHSLRRYVNTMGDDDIIVKLDFANASTPYEVIP